MDLVVDMGTTIVPVEVKSGRTLGGDAFRGLDGFGATSVAREGIVVHGGDESCARDPQRVRAWPGTGSDARPFAVPYTGG